MQIRSIYIICRQQAYIIQNICNHYNTTIQQTLASSMHSILRSVKVFLFYNWQFSSNCELLCFVKLNDAKLINTSCPLMVFKFWLYPLEIQFCMSKNHSVIQISYKSSTNHQKLNFLMLTCTFSWNPQYTNRKKYIENDSKLYCMLFNFAPENSIHKIVFNFNVNGKISEHCNFICSAKLFLIYL